MELREIELKMNEMCDLLGVSAQGLRLYEKHGAVHSFKYEGNGYRYFYFEDIGPAIHARSLRKLGLPLAQCPRDGEGQTAEELEATLADCRRKLEENIRYEQALLKQIDQLTAVTAWAADHVHEFRESTRPAMYYLLCETDGAFLSDPAGRRLLRGWSSAYPFVHFCPQVPAEGLGATSVSRVGLCLFERDGIAPPRGEHPQMLRLPEVPCVAGVVRVGQSTRDYFSVVQPGLAWLEEHGYTLTGDIYSVLLAAGIRADNDIFDYYYAWYPCEKSIL